MEESHIYITKRWEEWQMSKAEKLKFLEATKEWDFVKGVRDVQLSFLILHNTPLHDTYG